MMGGDKIWTVLPSIVGDYNEGWTEMEPQGPCTAKTFGLHIENRVVPETLALSV